MFDGNAIQGYTENTLENMMDVVKGICNQQVEPDGMRFDADTVRAERIMAETDYPGIRLQILGLLGKSDVWIHLDVSFANVITPSAQTLVEALRATFQARKTALPNELPAAFSDEFIREKQGDWRRFVSRFFTRKKD